MSSNLSIKKLVLGVGVALSLMQTGCSQVQEEQNAATSVVATAKAELDFSLLEGKALNEFYRNNDIATHTVLSGGTTPRLIVAFAADNSGTGLWFEPVKDDITWSKASNKQGVIEQDSNGHTLRGVTWSTETNAKELTVKKAVLSNIRVLRDYLWTEKVPNTITNQQTINGNTITWYRERLDKQSAYKLSFIVKNGRIDNSNDHIRFIAQPGKTLSFEISSLLANTPLTPIDVSEVLNVERANDYQTQQLLAFLSYEEKLFAGSWRFLTYFGRDTLMSIRLLMPVLSDKTMFAGLGSVLARVNDNGEVAHEEDLGEFAVLHSLKESKQASDTPKLDYKMVDDNYLLPIVLADYLNSHSVDEATLTAFLSQKAFNGKTYAEQLSNNFDFIYQSALPFYKDASYNNMIALLPDALTGEWRDSHEGLGYGRYPYNINAVFVPESLRAISQLMKHAVIAKSLNKADFTDIDAVYDTWYHKAPQHFLVSYSQEDVQTRVKAYAAESAVLPELRKSTAKKEDFYAIALNLDGSPVPVIHSDVGFALLFQKPDAKELDKLVDTALQPYPYGLLTDAGVLVANAAYANADTRAIFTNHYYHGAVVWSWQQAMMLSGVNNQLARDDLSASSIAKLKAAQTRLYEIVKNTQQINNSELWTWEYNNGQYQIVPFGQSAGHKSESNAAQLWSTVYLAIPGL